MKKRKWSIGFRIAPLIFALALFWHGSAHSLEPATLFAWVARQMDIDDAGPRPTVYYVDKAELQAVFSRANRRSYLRWEARFGTRKAKEFLNTYLEALAGMFDPDTKRIYIGRFLTKCRQGAVLAHEMTHYIQARTESRVDPDAHDADRIRLRQEMQADAIEQRYVERFCVETDARHAAPINP